MFEKNLYRAIIAALVFYILYHQGCVDKPCPPALQIVETKTDTIYQPVLEFVKEYVPKPYAVIKRDSLIVYDKLYVVEPVDTAAILADYFATAYYIDTANVEYGKMIIYDSISQNRIISRRFMSDLLIPSITNTVTLQPKKRMQLYAGVSAVGNKQTILHGFGGGFLLKTKRDQLYEAGVLFMNDALYYSAGLKFKLTKNPGY